MLKETMLARVRAALRHPRAGDAIRVRTGLARLSDPPPQPAFASFTSAGDAAVSRFRAEATAKGVALLDVRDRNELPGAVARFLREVASPADRIRLADLGLGDLPWQQAGFAVSSGAAGPGDMAGVSRAMAGIAETGTLMLASGPANPVTLALLPESHLVVLDRAHIVGTFEEAFAMLRKVYGVGVMPRTVNLVSGPSRTGDIGGRIVQGAHGPQHLAVLLIS